MTSLTPTKQTLNTTEMLEYAGLSRAGLHRARTAPGSDFPKPFALSVAPHRNLWKRSEIDAWVEKNSVPLARHEPIQLRGSQRGQAQHPQK